MKATLMKIGKAAVLAMALPLVSSAADAAKAAEAKRLNAEAVALMQKGDYAGAINGFKAALKTDRTCTDAVHNLGKLLILGKDYANARKLLQGSLAVVKDDTGAMIQIAQLSALEEKADECRAWTVKLAEKKDVELLKSLSVLLDRQGNGELAEFVLGRALKINDKDPEIWFNRGLVAQGRRDYVAAESHYRKAVNMDARYADAWVNLGNMCDRNGKTAESLPCYEKALAAKATPLAQYSVGRKIVLGSDPKRGLDLLEAAAKGRGPGVAEARRLLVELSKAADKVGGAK